MTVRLDEVQYRKGLVNYLDVLDAQRTTLAAETELVPTERARLTNMVGLFKALEEAGHRPPPRPLPDPLLGAFAEMEVSLAMDSVQHYDVGEVSPLCQDSRTSGHQPYRRPSW